MIENKVTCDLCKTIPPVETERMGAVSYWHCQPVYCVPAKNIRIPIIRDVITEGPYQFCQMCFTRMFNEYTAKHGIHIWN